MKGAGIIIVEENYINEDGKSGQTFILLSDGNQWYGDGVKR